MAARQVIFARNTANSGNSGNGYASPTAPRTYTNVELGGSFRMPCAGVWKNWKIALSAAPGAGKDYKYSVRTAGSNSALSITIADLATTGQDLSNTAAVSAGDNVTIENDPTGTPTQAAASWTLEFEPTTPGDSVYGVVSSATDAGTGTWQINPFLGRPEASATGNANRAVVAAPGDLTCYTVLLNTALSAGTQRDFAIYLNGVKQDGSGATVDTTGTITGNSAATTLDVNFTLPLVVGDTLYLEVVCTGSTGAKRPGYAACIRTTDTDAFNIFGATNVNAATATTEYIHPQNNPPAAGSWDTTEADVDTLLTAASIVYLSRLQLSLETAPGAGKSRTLSVRVAGASPGGTLSATVADAATTGFDAAGSNVITTSDLWALQSVPTNTPAAGDYSWGLAASTEAPVTTTNNGYRTDAGPGAPLTIYYTSTADALYVLLSWFVEGGAIDTRDRISTVTFNGDALTRGGRIPVKGQTMEWWRLAAPFTGDANVVITPATSGLMVTAGVVNLVGWPSALADHHFPSKEHNTHA